EKGYDAVATEVSALLPDGRRVERAWRNLGIQIPEHITLANMANFNPIYTCSFIAKAEIFRAAPSPLDFAKDFGVMWDYPFFAWVAKRYRIGYLDEPLSVYREGIGLAHANRAAIVEADTKVRQWIREGKL